MHIELLSTADLTKGLNKEQSQAVTQGFGPSLIVAGAGSGKTTVLTRRLIYLLSALSQPAHSIMAVTFTNKAAAEMKRRVENIAGEEFAKRLTIGTFHSICARLLRQEIESYKSPEGNVWKSNFVIYDETDSLNVLKAVVAKLNLDEKVFAPRDVKNAISSAKNDGYSANRYAQDARNYKEQRIAEIFMNYQAELARNNALDFDDLILTFAELLKENKEVLARLQNRYRHILVDEFQDTNLSQYELIRALAGENGEPHQLGTAFDTNNRTILVVGDVDQSIYSWRKADFRIFLGFQKDFANCEIIKLEDNYRSTQTILELANSVIANNTERLEKVLRGNRGQGGKVQCYEGADEIDEAHYIVGQLKRIKMQGKQLSDCALLYRTNAQSRALEEVLVRNNIPYTMIGATRFYDRQEIKDTIAYLKLIYNEQDGMSFLRVVNTPRRGLGKTSIDKLIDFAVVRNLSYIQAAQSAIQIEGLSAKTAKGFMSFADMVMRWQNLSRALPVSQLIELVLKETGYIQMLEEEMNTAQDQIAQGRLENLREFVGVAKEFESIADEPDLETFLTRISLVSDLDTANFAEDAVKLMTIHSAKGLEFPIVFLVGLEEGLFPHVRSLNSPAAMEEERRLMYVAITRAADLLHLTLARKRMSFTGNSGLSSNYAIPSRFLQEMDSQYLQGYYPDASRTRIEEKQVEEQWLDDGSFGYPPRNKPQAPHSYGRNNYQNQNSSGYSRSGSTNYAKSGQGGYSHPSNNNPRDRHPSTQPAAPKRAMRMAPAQAQQIIQSRESSIAGNSSYERMSVGDTVQHSKFGIGKISQVIGENDKELYNIEFQSSGKRLLDPRFAKLTKLN